MSRGGSVRPSTEDSPKQRRDGFLERHKARMSRVDSTITVVRQRAARSGRFRKKRSGS